MDTSAGTPTMTPPGAAGGFGAASVGTSRPEITDAAAAGAAQAVPQGPSLQPPAIEGSTLAAAAGAVTGAWHTGATVDALWAINQVRNAFMRVVGVGWKKIFNGTDGAFTALVTLASQARQTGKTINYREEADGMVHEIYLW